MEDIKGAILLLRYNESGYEVEKRNKEKKIKFDLSWENEHLVDCLRKRGFSDEREFRETKTNILSSKYSEIPGLLFDGLFDYITLIRHKRAPNETDKTEFGFLLIIDNIDQIIQKKEDKEKYLRIIDQLRHFIYKDDNFYGSALLVMRLRTFFDLYSPSHWKAPYRYFLLTAHPFVIYKRRLEMMQ